MKKLELERSKKDEVMSGYIKIDRKLLEWEWYKNEHTKTLFLHCLLKANWKDGKFEGKDIPRGSFVTSVKNLALDLDLTVDEIRTALKHLLDTKEITKQTTNKFTIITISNYELYQEVTEQLPKQLPKQIPNNSQTIPKQFPTIEERKERKNINNIYIQIKDLFNDICVSFPKVTKLSDQRKKTLKARLNTYNIDDFERMFKLAEQSNFLKGKNNKDWQANFDWLIKDANMAKVLDGNYNNKSISGQSRMKTKQSFDQREYDYDELERSLIANRERKRKEQY